MINDNEVSLYRTQLYMHQSEGAQSSPRPQATVNCVCLYLCVCVCECVDV